MIEKINNNHVHDIVRESSAKQSESSMNCVNNQIDALLQVDCKDLIEAAKQLPTEDANAVQRAKELLLSGELDSPENIRAAAENIVKYGI